MKTKNIKQIKECDEKLGKNISESCSKSSKSNEEPNLDNKNEENENKKENNDDEDDILSEQKDEMEEDDNNLININKVESIKIHPSFIPRHNYTGSGFSYNSNTRNKNVILNQIIHKHLRMIVIQVGQIIQEIFSHLEIRDIPE